MSNTFDFTTDDAGFLYVSHRRTSAQVNTRNKRPWTKPVMAVDVHLAWFGSSARTPELHFTDQQTGSKFLFQCKPIIHTSHCGYYLISTRVKVELDGALLFVRIPQWRVYNIHRRDAEVTPTSIRFHIDAVTSQGREHLRKTGEMGNLEYAHHVWGLAWRAYVSPHPGENPLTAVGRLRREIYDAAIRHGRQMASERRLERSYAQTLRDEEGEFLESYLPSEDGEVKVTHRPGQLITSENVPSTKFINGRWDVDPR